eukprot:Skav211702  [mRNA]  locus=scaffold1535:232354:232590:- [translate_table: standard]
MSWATLWAGAATPSPATPHPPQLMSTSSAAARPTPCSSVDRLKAAMVQATMAASRISKHIQIEMMDNFWRQRIARLTS